MTMALQDTTKKDIATFFDIHRRPQHEPVHLSLDAFLETLPAGQLFDSDTSLVPCPPVPRIDHALQVNTADWLQLQMVLVWSLTGMLADKETMYPYRDIYQSLLKKYNLESTFTLSVLFAYLIAGFRVKRNGWSCEDKNNVDDFKHFCSQLLDPSMSTLDATTFMCAHREADEEDPNKLVKKLKTVSFVRAINVIKGLVHNTPHTNVQLTIYHLNENKYSLLAIFPNIIFKYLETDGLGKLLQTLGEHYVQIEALATQLATDKLVITMVPTQQHITDTRRLCKELGGKDWRLLTPHVAAQSLTNSHLHEITAEAAMEEVARYMPEYSAVKIDSFASMYERHPQDEDTMKWYAEQERLSPYAKALYETLFYYNWGQKVASKHGIAIGLDRDHSDFQIRAFHTGFNATYTFGSTAPVAYLRRSEREVGKTDIHSVSLRQFWRHSADDRR